MGIGSSLLERGLTEKQGGEVGTIMCQRIRVKTSGGTHTDLNIDTDVTLSV